MYAIFVITLVLSAPLSSFAQKEDKTYDKEHFRNITEDAHRLLTKSSWKRIISFSLQPEGILINQIRIDKKDIEFAKAKVEYGLEGNPKEVFYTILVKAHAELEIDERPIPLIFIKKMGYDLKRRHWRPFHPREAEGMEEVDLSKFKQLKSRARSHAYIPKEYKLKNWTIIKFEFEKSTVLDAQTREQAKNKQLEPLITELKDYIKSNWELKAKELEGKTEDPSFIIADEQALLKYQMVLEGNFQIPIEVFRCKEDNSKLAIRIKKQFLVKPIKGLSQKDGPYIFNGIPAITHFKLALVNRTESCDAKIFKN